ncbi:hypothetical protein [Pseudomonas phage COT4]|nr:hypothetical protein [Pseudomonas phage COT4]
MWFLWFISFCQKRENPHKEGNLTRQTALMARSHLGVGQLSVFGALSWYRAKSSGFSIQCFYLVSLECELVALVDSNHILRSLSTVL